LSVLNKSTHDQQMFTFREVVHVVTLVPITQVYVQTKYYFPFQHSILKSMV